MDDAGIAIEAAVPAPLCHTSMEPNLAARFTVLPPPPPPAGAVHVPSARRKFVVPPPEADTQPGKELVNTLHSVVSCAAVMGVAGAGEPLTFPATVLFGYCPD